LSEGGLPAGTTSRASPHADTRRSTLASCGDAATATPVMDANPTAANMATEQASAGKAQFRLICRATVLYLRLLVIVGLLLTSLAHGGQAGYHGNR
jgi:hypothetical protein